MAEALDGGKENLDRYSVDELISAIMDRMVAGAESNGDRYVAFIDYCYELTQEFYNKMQKLGIEPDTFFAESVDDQGRTWGHDGYLISDTDDYIEIDSYFGRSWVGVVSGLPLRAVYSGGGFLISKKEPQDVLPRFAGPSSRHEPKTTASAYTSGQLDSFASKWTALIEKATLKYIALKQEADQGVPQST